VPRWDQVPVELDVAIDALLARDTLERALRFGPDLAWCVLEVLVSRIRG
jgi:hypothetical protein